MDYNQMKLDAETSADRIFQEAAGPNHYPSWLYIGGPGLKGAGDRFVACFMPWTIKRK